MILISDHKIYNFFARCGLVAVLFASSPLWSNVSAAQGEHARRIGSELTVLLGDLRMLASDEVAEQHKSGLRQRILGGLVALDILARLADQELGRPSQSRIDLLSSMREDIHADRWDRIQHALTNLLEEYPLELPDFKISDTSEFAALHQSLCAACHDRPVLTVERPAYNLSVQSAGVSELEMFARMLVGVRGDRVTGIDNPLTDHQIAGLLHYYRNAQAE